MIPDSIKGNSKRVYKGGREKSKRMADTKKNGGLLAIKKKKELLKRVYAKRNT